MQSEIEKSKVATSQEALWYRLRSIVHINKRLLVESVLLLHFTVALDVLNSRKRFHAYKRTLATASGRT
jgi:hypothetical protein